MMPNYLIRFSFQEFHSFNEAFFIALSGQLYHADIFYFMPTKYIFKFNSERLKNSSQKGCHGNRASLYLKSLQMYASSRHLLLLNEQCLVVPSQWGMKSLSKTFTLSAPLWTNELPTCTQTAETNRHTFSTPHTFFLFCAFLLHSLFPNLA